MSTIATFHLIPMARIHLLKEAAIPDKIKKPFLWVFSKTVVSDRFWKVLAREGKELKPFKGSGDAFNILDLMMEEQGVAFFPNEGLSHYFSEKRGASFSIYDQKDAESMLQRLAGSAVAKKDVRKFLIDEFDDDAGAQPVVEALNTFKKWLKQVDSSVFGILYVG